MVFWARKVSGLSRNGPQVSYHLLQSHMGDSASFRLPHGLSLPGEILQEHLQQKLKGLSMVACIALLIIYRRIHGKCHAEQNAGKLEFYTDVSAEGNRATV